MTGTIIDDIKNFSGDINALVLPILFQNRIIFSAGVHNGVTYTTKEIENASKFDELPIFVDHNEDVKNQVGVAKNGWFQKENSYSIADVCIFDITTATKILLGAKWGISPRLDYEETKNENVAKNTIYRSFSIVVHPADTRTMLNSEDINSNTHNTNNNTNNNNNNKNIQEKNMETTEQPGAVKKEIAEKFISLEAGKKLLELNSLEDVGKKIRELLGLDYSVPATTNEELEKVKKEANILREQINTKEKQEAERDINATRNKVATKEIELGLTSDINQATAELGKFGKSELEGMFTAYNKVDSFIQTAENLSMKKGEIYEQRNETKNLKSAEQQMFDLCKNIK